MWKSVGGQYTSCKVPGGRNKTAAAAARRTRRDMVCYQDQDTSTRSRSRTLVRGRTVVLEMLACRFHHQQGLGHAETIALNVLC